MKYLEGMTDLRILDLSESIADDTALDQIAKLKKLEDLNLWLTDVGDEGVAKLADTKSLKRLNLDKTRVTNTAMDAVGKLENLEFLHIGSTMVTDEGIAKLHGLKNLKKLVITFLGVSDDAIAQLQEAVPALKADGAIER
jgi:hypothetical protein